jgi:putative membrane protein
MQALAFVLTAVIALEHFYFLVLEMFFWQKPLGLKTFRNSAAQAKSSAVLAANQGLYNGFLGAGLLWSLFAGPALAPALRIFFLTCVAIAGCYGAYSVSRRIFFVQALPALLALALLAPGLTR